MFSKLNIVDNEKTQFDINNKGDLKISLINGLKRTIYGKIPVYAIDTTSINFITNNTTYDNSFLTLRLALIPIRSDLDIDYENTVIEYHYKNNDELIHSCYCKDFQVDNPELFAYPETLFTKIKPSQELHFTCKLSKNNCLSKNASYCCVSNASYKFKLDEKAIQEKVEEENMTEEEERSFRTLEGKRLYLKNKDDEPSVYHFTLENCGNYDNQTIMNYGIDILSLQLKDLATAFNENNTEKFNIQKANSKFDSYDITVVDENDTIGNLLTTYLTDNNEVDYAAYKIPHPLHNKLVFRIACKNNDITTIMEVINDTIKVILNILENMKKEWNASYKSSNKKKNSKK